MPTKKKKSLPSWTRGDTAFVLTVLVVVVWTGWVLKSSLEATGGVGSTQPIGVIIFKQKVAERKFSNQVLWGQIVSRSPVYNFDTVRTGPGALAVVELDDGTEINLDEETMVGLEMRQKAFSVALVTGSVAAKRAALAGTPFSVRSQGVDLSVEKGSLSVSRQGESLLLHSDSAIQVTSGGSTSTVSGDQTALVAPGAAPVIQRQTVDLLEPRDAAYVLAPRESTPLTFRWASREPESMVQISKVNTFDPVVREAATNQSEIRLDLPRGTFYWRVVPQSGGPSAVRRVVVLEAAAPQPVEPAGVQSSVDPAQALVSFSWTASPNAGAYRLEVTDASGAAVRTATTTVTTLSFSGLPEGRYRWRPVAMYAFADSELAGPWRDFTVQKLEKISAPEPLSTSGASAGAPSQFSVLDRTSAVIAWEPVPSAQAYVVEIATDPEFKHTVSRSTTRSNVLRPPTDLPQGDYYWRVKAVADDQDSDYSARRTFSVVASLPLVALSPQEGASVGEKVPLLWNDPNHGDQYRVEVSTDEKFTTIAGTLDVSSSGLTDSRNAKLSWPSTGAFYWRVSLRGEGAITATSHALRFLRAGGLETPALKEPQDGSVLDVNGLTSLSLRWSPVELANQYRWALYRIVAGRPQLVLNAQTSQTSVVLNQWDLLSLDSYQWTVTAAAVKNGRDSQVSQPAQGVFALTRRRPLQAPVVTIPQVLYLAPESP